MSAEDWLWRKRLGVYHTVFTVLAAVVTILALCLLVGGNRRDAFTAALLAGECFFLSWIIRFIRVRDRVNESIRRLTNSGADE